MELLEFFIVDLKIEFEEWLDLKHCMHHKEYTYPSSFNVYLLIFSQHHLWSSWQPFTWHHLVQKWSKLGVGSHQIYSCRKIFSRHRHFGCFWCWHLYMHVWLFFMLDPNIYCLKILKNISMGKFFPTCKNFPLFQGQKSFWKCHSQLYAGGHSSQSPNLTWPSSNSDRN